MQKGKGKLAQVEEYVINLKNNLDTLEEKVNNKLVFDANVVQKRIEILRPIVYRLSAILELE